LELSKQNEQKLQKKQQTLQEKQQQLADLKI
jgi:hypothetical protein